MSEIQLTSANGFNVNNIIFSKPQAGGLKDTSVKFRRIYLSTKYADGSEGDLIISTPRIFSFGVSENMSQDDKNKTNGFVFPLDLFDKNGASEDEKIFLDTFNKIVNHTKKHILDNKKELKLPSIDESDLKKFNPIFYKKDKDTVISFNMNTAEAMTHAAKNMNPAMLQILKAHMAGRGSQ